MKILVTGSRSWSSQHVEIIHRELVKFPSGTILIHGACEGVDTIAGLVGHELGFIVRDYPAMWNVHGYKAGPIRNRYMVQVEHVEHEPINLVLGFHDCIEKSKGTKDMLNVAKKAKIEWLLIAA